MDYSKYIIVEEMGHSATILFSPLISHDTFLNCYAKNNILSAGFFRINNDNNIVTFGKSITLNLSPKDGDSVIIRKILDNPY